MIVQSGLTRSQQIGLLIAGFMVLVAMSGVSLWLVRQARDADRLIIHTLTVTNVIAAIRADIRRAESGERGYLLTSDEAYLQDYQDAIQVLPVRVDQLAALIAGRPTQNARLERLKTHLGRKMDVMGEVVHLVGLGRAEQALAQISTDIGLGVMADIRSVLVEMLNDEQADLIQRQDVFDRASLYLYTVNATGGVIMAILAVIAVVMVRRNADQLATAHRDLEQINDELEHRIAERTSNLSEANKEIQRFAYVVSHDLRAPLVNIMGFTSELETIRDELFARGEQSRDRSEDGDVMVSATVPARLREEYDEALGFIKSSIGRMEALINTILRLSRAGRREFQPQAIDLMAMMRDIAAAVAHRLNEQNIALEISPLPQVTSDRLALEQVLMNLVDNAIKYMRSDVDSRIGISATDSEGHILLHVSDNGRGIAQGDQVRIFDLFRRAGMQDRPGEGIGLAYARILMRHLGGWIKVSSVPDEGSTFTIAIPKTWMPAQ